LKNIWIWGEKLEECGVGKCLHSVTKELGQQNEKPELGLELDKTLSY